MLLWRLWRPKGRRPKRVPRDFVEDEEDHLFLQEINRALRAAGGLSRGGLVVRYAPLLVVAQRPLTMSMVVTTSRNSLGKR